MGVRTPLSQTDYILSNDIILKTKLLDKWCKYVPLHSYEQQGRYRYVCENPDSLPLPTIEVVSSKQSGDNWCITLKTNDAENYINLEFPNGYVKEYQGTLETSTICIPYRKIGDSGTVKIKAYDSLGTVSTPTVEHDYSRTIVSIPVMFYPLDAMIWGRIRTSTNSEVEVWINGLLDTTYNSGANTDYIFRATRRYPDNGTMEVFVTKDGLTVSTTYNYRNDWGKITLDSDVKISPKEKPTIQIKILSGIEGTYFDGIDTGMDEVQVK